MSSLLGVSIVPLIVGFAFWDPLRNISIDAALFVLGEETTGYVTKAEEEAEIDEYGREFSFYRIHYAFEKPDGNFVFQSIAGEGRVAPCLRPAHLPAKIGVTFLPFAPNVSRPTSEGRSSIGILVSKVLFAVSLLSAWLWFCGQALRQHRDALAKPRDKIEPGRSLPEVAAKPPINRASQAIYLQLLPAPPPITAEALQKEIESAHSRNLALLPVVSITSYKNDPQGPKLAISMQSIFELVDDYDTVTGIARIAASRDGTYFHFFDIEKRLPTEDFLSWVYEGGLWDLRNLKQSLA